MELKKPLFLNHHYKFSSYHLTKSDLSASDIENPSISSTSNITDSDHAVYKSKKSGITIFKIIPLQTKCQKICFVINLVEFIFFLAAFIYYVIICWECPLKWGVPAGVMVEQCIFLCRMLDVYAIGTESKHEPGFGFRFVAWLSTCVFLFTNVWMEVSRRKPYVVVLMYMLAVAHAVGEFWMLVLPIEHDRVGRERGDDGYVVYKIGRWKWKVLYW